MYHLPYIFLAILASWSRGASGDCTHGEDQLNEGTKYTERGQFVDLDHPINCSGVLTSLQFCYYTNNNNNNDDEDRQSTSQTVYFRLFHYDPIDDVLRLVYTLDKMMQVENTRRSFRCAHHYYDETERVNVYEGDYIAVYLPSFSQPLSVIGKNIPGVTLYKDTRHIGTQFLSTTLEKLSTVAVDGVALHISANIVSQSHDSGNIINALLPINIPELPASPSSSPIPTPTHTRSSASSILHTSTNPAAKKDSSVSTSKSTHSSFSSVVTKSESMNKGVVKPSSAQPSTNTTMSFFAGTMYKEKSSTIGSSFFTPHTTMSNKADKKIPAWVIPLASSVGFLLVVAFIVANNIFVCICIRKCRKKERSVLKKPERVSVAESSFYDVVGPTQQPVGANSGESGEDHCYNVLEPTVYEVPNASNPSTNQPDTANTETDATYSVLGPDVDCSEQRAPTEEPEIDAHYEVMLQEVFEIYSTPVSMRKGETLSKRIRKVMSTISDQTPVPYHKPPSEERAIYEQLSIHNPTINIPATQIRIMGQLGSGHFASVERGVWNSRDGDKDVAIKTLHCDAREANRVKCLQEAAIMAQFHHPNIVQLHGIVDCPDRTISMVMEFLHGGDLCERLRIGHRENGVDANTPLVLLNYSIQVTLGMLYLSEKGFVHRDLAARNVLISDRDICKIGDFGMSRELEDSTYYRSAGGTIPVKWTAPEAAFYGKYSSASDVWSFGCVLYEIWSLGEKPFSALPNNEVLTIVKAGCRLSPPPGCSYEVYKLMIDCWHPVPTCRPSFKDILTLLIGDEETLLAMPLEYTSLTDSDAGRLGAPLRAGMKLYPSLQTKYLSNER